MNRPDTNSPAGIFFLILDRIENRLKKAKRPRAFKDKDLANDLRGELFKLEGWAKIHRHWPEKKERKVFDHLRNQSKTLEDAFGALDLARSLAEDLRAKGQPDLANVFDEQADLARHKLKHTLKSQDWFGDRVAKMRSSLEEIEWPSTAKQNDILVRALISDLDHLGVRYREHLKPALLKNEYDRPILENDLHKLRRQLRWFSMYFITANGLIALGPVGTHLTAEKKKLVQTYAGSEFATLPKKFKAVAHVDPLAFYELTRLVEILGVVKDQAERYFNLQDCIKDYARARALYGDVPNETPKKTHPILAEYERLKPVAYLAKSLADRR